MQTTKSKVKRNVILTLSIMLASLIGYTVLEVNAKAKFDKPTGPYAVSAKGYEWTDETRIDPETKRPRRLLVHAWYPTDHIGSKKMPYHPNPDELATTLSELYGIPTFLINKLAKSSVHSFENAPLSAQKARFPVLIFSHGWNGTRFQNTYQMQELASHGYVIFSLEHSFSAAGTLFSDGSKGGIIAFEDIHKDSINERWLQVWSADQIFALNQIERLNQEDMTFKNGLNLSKVGVFGHSFGGNAAANTLTLDQRFKAGINLDGYYFGKQPGSQFVQPFLEVRAPWLGLDDMSDEQLQKNYMMNRQEIDELLANWDIRIKEYASNGYTKVEMPGANHMSFSDFTLMFPFKWLLAPKAKDHHRLSNKVVKAFFDHHLLGKALDFPKSEQLIYTDVMP